MLLTAEATADRFAAAAAKAAAAQVDQAQALREASWKKQTKIKRNSA